MKICIVDHADFVIPVMVSTGGVVLVKDPVPEYTAPTLPALNEMILTCAVSPLPDKPRYLNRAERRKLNRK